MQVTDRIGGNQVPLIAESPLASSASPALGSSAETIFASQSQESLPIEKGRFKRFMEAHQDLIYVGLLISASALLVIGILSVVVVGGVAGVVMGFTFIPSSLLFFWLGGSSILEGSETFSSKRSQEWQKFMKFTQDHFEIIDVGGEGNCLFLSLAFHFKDIPGFSDHKQVRKSITDYMASKQDEFRLVMEDDTSLEDYLGEMKKEGIWGGEQEVSAISRLLNEELGRNYSIIVRDPSKGCEIVYPASKVENPKEEETRFYLLHIGNHWQVLKVKPESPRGLKLL